MLAIFFLLLFPGYHTQLFVRILQNQFKIDPKRITAGGRGEYLPVAANDDTAGRNLNRRTRIVILPQLDQFFKLLESPKS